MEHGVIGRSNEMTKFSFRMSCVLSSKRAFLSFGKKRFAVTKLSCMEAHLLANVKDFWSIHQYWMYTTIISIWNYLSLHSYKYKLGTRVYSWFYSSHPLFVNFHEMCLFFLFHFIYRIQFVSEFFFLFHYFESFLVMVSVFLFFFGIVGFHWLKNIFILICKGRM